MKIMERRNLSCKRTRFEVVNIGEYRLYTLFSEEYHKCLELHINWLVHDTFDSSGRKVQEGLEEPDLGDIFELPDRMLCYDFGKPMFSIHELSFDHPYCEDEAEEFAYITYKKTNKRFLIQRTYG